MATLAEAMRRVESVELGELLRELARAAGLECGPPVMAMLAEVFDRGDDGEQTFEVQVGGDPRAVRSALALAALGWVFLDRQRVLWVAPSHVTLAGAARLLVDGLDGSPELSKHVRRASRANGSATVETHAGGRVMFRTLGGARGVAADKLVVDDAEAMPEFWRPQLMPCLMGRPGAQAVLGMPTR